MDQRFDDPFVPLIEPVAIDLEHGQGAVRQVRGDFAVGFDLDVIAHPAQKIIRRAWCPPRARGDLGRAGMVDLHTEQSGAAQDDLLHFIGRVVIEPCRHPEPRPQWRADHAGARGRADQRKLWQLQSETARLRSLIDDNIEAVIFHRRVEILFNRRLKPVDFVDEQDIAFFQTR